MSSMLRRFIGEFVTVKAFGECYTGRLMGFDSGFLCIQQFNPDGSHKCFAAQPLVELVRLEFGGDSEQEERLRVEFYRNTKKQIESIFNDSTTA